MNLTVGPLPPAVYWRRRAILIGALLLVVILLVSTCGGSGKAGSPRNTSARQSPTSTPNSNGNAIAPIIGEGGDAGGGDPPSPDPGTSAPTADVPAGDGGGDIQPSASGPCSDSDLSLTAVVTPLAKGFYFSMKVKNISTNACSRDVGGGPQALTVVNSAGTVVWTSDLCAAAGKSPDPDVRTFGPNIETILPPRPFYWDGTVGRCSGGVAPQPGDYRMVARLGSKASTPVAVIGK
ncbi:MAG TPA: hypothetical protein VJT31_41770 [Rugosimonospora sp.]|nr:hypothetical protein [Rugosimonospora sp.]